MSDKRHTSVAGAAGFTLIELMIVVAIIGILASLAIPNYLKFTCRVKQSEMKANANTIGKLMSNARTDKPTANVTIRVDGCAGTRSVLTGSAANQALDPANFHIKGKSRYVYLYSFTPSSWSLTVTGCATDTQNDVWSASVAPNGLSYTLNPQTDGCL